MTSFDWHAELAASIDRVRPVDSIKGVETGDRAVAKALDVTRQIRKSPIAVTVARAQGRAANTKPLS